MKKISTIILFFAFLSTTSAQDFAWAKEAGHWAYDYGYGVCTDAAGNVYVAGKFEEDGAVFGDTTVLCAGNHDMFVAKYDSNGNFLWVRTGGGPGGDYAHAVTCDALGNVYVAGELEGSGTFGDTTITGHTGDDDILVVKYDTDGNLIWIKTYGGWSREDARGIAVDAIGNSYIIGVFKDESFFGTVDTLTSRSAGIDDAFIAKLDVNGNILWVKQIGDTGDDTGKGIAVDALGNVYGTGGFLGTADIGGATLTSAGYRDLYLGKWDTDGNLQWAKKAGGPYDDVSWAITLDNTGNPYITGEFNADAYFDALPAIYADHTDMFVAKYNPAGDAQWVKGFGDSLIDLARGIATDNTNLYITGQFGGSITLGSKTVNAADSSDIFVASYSIDGIERWIMAPHGAADSTENLGYEGGNAISADASGMVYVTGSFLNTDTLGGTVLQGWTRTDMFVAKVDQALSSIHEKEFASGTLSISPNPSTGQFAISLKGLKDKKYTLNIINALGQSVYSETLENISGSINKQIDLNVKKGIYFLELKNETGKAMEKIIIY